MARIPDYQQAGPQSVELSAPKQHLNIPPAAFGSDGRALQEAGKGLQDNGTVLAAISSRMAEEADTRAATDAYIKRQKEMHNYTANGVYNVSGAGVEGATRNFESFLESLHEDAVSNLSTERARQLFSEKFNALGEVTRGAVALHEAKELRVANVDTQTRLAQAAGERAVDSYTNGPLREQALAEHDEALREVAKLKGMTPEATKLLAEDSKSKTLVQMAERFIVAGKYDEARSLIADERMLGLDRKAVEAKLRPAEVDAAGMDIAKQWLGKGIDTVAALKSAETIPDKQVRASALHNFNVYNSAVKAERSRAEADATERVYNKLDSLSGDLLAQDTFVKSIGDRKVQDRARARYNQLYAGPQGLAGTDPGAYVNVLAGIDDGSINSKEALLSHPDAHKLSRSALTRAEAELKGAQKVSTKDLMTAFKFGLGYEHGDNPQVKLSEDDKKSFMKFEEYARKKLSDSNRAGDPKYVKELVKDWLLPGETKSSWSPGWGADTTRGEAGGDTAFLPFIPEGDVGLVDKSWTALPAEARTAWLDKFEDNEEYAKRGFYDASRKALLGPKKK